MTYDDDDNDDDGNDVVMAKMMMFLVLFVIPDIKFKSQMRETLLAGR